MVLFLTFGIPKLSHERLPYLYQGHRLPATIYHGNIYPGCGQHHTNSGEFRHSVNIPLNASEPLVRIEACTCYTCNSNEYFPDDYCAWGVSILPEFSNNVVFGRFTSYSTKS